MEKVHLKWLYIGTERGNVHLVNYENFLLNDYVINWNKGKSIILSLAHTSHNRQAFRCQLRVKSKMGGPGSNWTVHLGCPRD